MRKFFDKIKTVATNRINLETKYTLGKSVPVFAFIHNFFQDLFI